MKVALISDTHFGIRGDAQTMLDYQELFYKNVFFPYLKQNDIKTVFHLGDLFDRRKYINFVTLARTKEMFLNPLRDNNIDMYIIPGNHDVYFKNSNDLNSLKEFLCGYENICVFEQPYVFEEDNRKVAFVPWINSENNNSIIQWIENLENNIILAGHFDISGFEMYAGVKSEHGMNADLFKKFDQVWSGHFHHKSTKGNIHYLGAPMEFIFADCDDERGFHIWDTETNKLEFIQNPYNFYKKLYYNDETTEDREWINSLSKEDFENKTVKVYVVRKTCPGLFETFIDKLYNANNINLSIHEKYSEFHESNVDLEEIKVQSTQELIERYVDQTQTDMNKDKIKSILNTLYIEALHVDTASKEI